MRASRMPLHLGAAILIVTLVYTLIASASPTVSQAKVTILPKAANLQFQSFERRARCSLAFVTSKVPALFARQGSVPGTSTLNFRSARDHRHPFHYQRVRRFATSLFGKVEFTGLASAKISGTSPPLKIPDESADHGLPTKSLALFLSTSASDAVLLGMKNDGKQKGISQCERIDSSDYGRNNGELWECRQASIEWFGLTLVPVFINSIERSDPGSTEDRNVVISIIDAKTEVQKGGKLGNTLASAMKRSVFEGRNVIRWQEQATKPKDTTNIVVHNYTLEGSIKLSLTITLPPFLPLPPGFNTIGSKIVERTCRDRLRQNLEDVSAAYLQWAKSNH